MLFDGDKRTSISDSSNLALSPTSSALILGSKVVVNALDDGGDDEGKDDIVIVDSDGGRRERIRESSKKFRILANL